MNRSLLSAVAAGIACLVLLRQPGAAQTNTAAAQPRSVRDALLGSKWSWQVLNGKRRSPEEVIFRPDGGVDRSWKAPNTWTWEAIDDHSFQIIAKWKKVDRFVFKFDPAFTKFETTDFFGTPASGTRHGATAGPSAPPSTAPTPSTRPVSSATAASPDGRSQLSNFWSQIPQAAAWTYSSLDLAAPDDFAAKLTMFKRGLMAESSRGIPQLQKAYQRAIILTDMMGAAYAQRSQLLKQATGGTGKNPPPAAVAQWTGLATTQRHLFRSPRAILDEAVFAGGGLAKAIPVINENFPLAVVPAAPASAESHDFDATPAWVNCSGHGPAGTNFGWGDRRLKLDVEVASNSDVNIPVSVESYWVSWDGQHHLTYKADTHSDFVSGAHPVAFTIGNDVRRNNGASYGVQDNLVGVYRGWLIILRDKGGKRISSAANVVEFNKLIE